MIERPVKKLDPKDIVLDEKLLDSFLRIHPEFKKGQVCSCGRILSFDKMPGHIGGSNKHWAVKAKTKKGKRFKPKHRVIGYTIIGKDESYNGCKHIHCRCP